MAIKIPLDARPISKAAAAYEAIRRAIVDGTITPGTHLRQDELAEHWQVSSTPVREAFRRLEAEGLVELLPHRGVRVKQVTQSGDVPLVSAADLEPGSDFP
jgi:DNA-binding GntR family transcriptional regulator